MDDQNLIFLSYSSPDREAVLAFYDDLKRAGFNVWMDKPQLKGGQNWNFEIKRALQKAVIIVVFVSNNSVDRRGYAQREIKIAIDQALDRLIDDIYLIPLLLHSNVSVPSELARIHCIGLDEQDPKRALQDAISHQLERLGVQSSKVQEEANVRWSMLTHRDEWDGLPGYDVSYQLPHFSSIDYPHVSEITDVVRGTLQSLAMSEREVKFDQASGFFNFGQSKFRRQNTWESTCGEPKVQGRMLSLVYSIWWYGAGAAHPNQNFLTFCFSLDPVVQFRTLEHLFANAEEAFAIIQSECREQLGRIELDGTSQEFLTLDREWVERGTEEWKCFRNFSFNADGIEILFSPYEVAPYAFGPQFVKIPYGVIATLLRKEIASLLEIEHFRTERLVCPSTDPIAGDTRTDETSDVRCASATGTGEANANEASR